MTRARASGAYTSKTSFVGAYFIVVDGVNSVLTRNSPCSVHTARRLLSLVDISVLAVIIL